MGPLATLARLPLASALRGVRRLEGLRAAGSGARWPRTLDALSDAAAAELGEVPQMLFHAGAELSSEWLDIGLGLLSGQHGAAARAGRRSGDVLRLLSPERGGSYARLEARHKLEVFWQVRRARRVLGTPRHGRPFDVLPYLERALALEDGLGFWALEGLGHDYVLAHLEGAAEPGHCLLGSLRDPGGPNLDPAALSALHAGLGLAVSEYLLGGLRSTDPAERFERCARRFQEICCRHAADAAQAEVALETLGLVARVFFPSLFGGLAEALEQGERQRRLFWHGAGRGFYFQGGQLLPGYGSLGRALGMARRIHPVESGLRSAQDQHDALAGLAYAFTMVNRRSPELVAAALPAVRPEETGFGEGVAGALAMAALLDGDGAATSWIRKRPENADPQLWRDLVEVPHTALQRLGQQHGLYGALPWGGT